jgi:ABC-type polysaccharide/polyol phosphate export permease
MAAISEVWTYRGLIGNLAQRELKSRYKRSVLGWMWSLLNPASTLLIYTVVFGTIMRIEPPIAGNGTMKSFALFLFSALIIWNFFSGVISGSMGALIGAGGLLKKVYFPPECPPIANALTVLTQTALEALILVVVLAFVGNLSWTVLLFPYLIVMLALFSLGIGLVLSLLNVYLRDINYLVSIGLNLLFYGTPIIYPFSLLVNNDVPGWIQFIVRVNPLTQFVGASQQIFYLLETPSLARLGGLTVVSLVVFALGWAIFSAKSLDVSEEL